MAGDTSGKTEKPTPKKIKDSVKEGQFARTPDAATWLAIAAGVALLPMSARATTAQFREAAEKVSQDLAIAMAAAA